MASPFSIFRKNQKVMLAVLDALGDVRLRVPAHHHAGDGNAGGPPIRSWSRRRSSAICGNRISAGCEDSRQKVRTVLTELWQKAGQDPADIDEALQKVGIGPATDEAVVDTWLQARHAEQMGMVVDKDDVQ